MKTGRNLQEVLVELNRQNQAKQDFISPAQGMHLREDGHTFEINHLTTNQQEVFGTTSLFHRQVASALGIPAKYYDLMQKEKPELLAENVNSWFADKPSSYMVRSMDYGAGQVARALLSERYRRIDNMEIATAVLPLFAGNDQYEVMSCEVTENRLYLKVVNHRLEMEVRKGDIVQAGVMISNSEVGLGAVSIQPLVYRLFKAGNRPELKDILSWFGNDTVLHIGSKSAFYFIGTAKELKKDMAFVESNMQPKKNADEPPKRKAVPVLKRKVIEVYSKLDPSEGVIIKTEGSESGNFWFGAEYYAAKKKYLRDCRKRKASV